MPVADSSAGSVGVPAFDQPGAAGSDGLPSEAELAARFWDRIRVFAARRLGDTAAAEDVAQETLRRVGEALRAARIEHPPALAAFVYQTARHVCMQLQRSKARELRALERVSGDHATRGHPGDALAALIAEERRTAVCNALGALDQADCEVLRLTYYDQLSADEIAARLRSTPGAVRVRKHRALRRLADRLAPASIGNVMPASGT
jgi:RNA polymerase sigma factor (sigma-70 family)